MPVKKVTSNKKQVTSKKTIVIPSETRNLKIKTASKSRDSSPAKPVQNDKKEVAKSSAKRTNALSVPVYSLDGRATGTMRLPKEIFGIKVNTKLLAQAVRVYSANQKTHPGFTKTRGQVKASTAKIFRQKGTGRARHGSISAPIFVGGGIVFGPKPRKVTLELPKKMKKAALISALTAKAIDNEIIGVSGLEKASGKTKEMVGLLAKINTKSALVVTDDKIDNVVREARNIPGVDVMPVTQINAYEILRHHNLLITKEAIERLK